MLLCLVYQVILRARFAQVAPIRNKLSRNGGLRLKAYNYRVNIGMVGLYRIRECDDLLTSGPRSPGRPLTPSLPGIRVTKKSLS